MADSYQLRIYFSLFAFPYVYKDDEIKAIWYDDRIVKLHIQKASDYNGNHRNWGDVKGEDEFNDVCVILNKTSYKAFKEGKLNEIAPLTKAKLYVAITRARGNVYFIDFKKVSFLLSERE